MRLMCLECGGEANTDDPGMGNLKACPQCGATGIPADLDDTGTVVITRHELRILTMWADNYARSITARHPGSDKVVRTIVDRLGTQTDTPLTLSHEFADLRAEFGEVRVYRDGELTDE